MVNDKQFCSPACAAIFQARIKRQEAANSKPGVSRLLQTCGSDPNDNCKLRLLRNRFLRSCPPVFLAAPQRF